MMLDRWNALTATTPGYFMPEAAATWDALLDFQESSGLRGVLGEIGVYYAKSASLLALHVRDEELLLLIDQGFPPEARALLTGLVPPERLRLVQKRSSQIVSLPEATSLARRFRWFHIDGEHTGEAVVNDLDLACRWVDDSGIVCLDDFFNPMYPQVTAAAFHFLARRAYELTLFLCGHNKGYLCRPMAAPRYLAAIATDLVSELARRGVRNITVCKTTAPSDMNCFGVTFRFADRDYYGLDSDPSRLLL